MRILVFVMAIAGAACTSGSAGTATATLGAECKEAQAQSDLKVCNTSRTESLECKANGATYQWKSDKNCAAQGLTCENGACVAGKKSGSSDAGGTTKQDTAGGGGGSTCTNMAGPWTVGKHCDPKQVGTTFTVSQSGCNFSFTGAGLTSASGTVTGTTDITVKGTSLTGPFSCTGTIDHKASSGAIDEVNLACTQNCSIQVKPAN